MAEGFGGASVLVGLGWVEVGALNIG